MGPRRSQRCRFSQPRFVFNPEPLQWEPQCGRRVPACGCPPGLPSDRLAGSAGKAPLLDVAHCLVSGTEVTLLSKGMTYPLRCHYSYFGINRDISRIGQVLYGAYLVPCSLSDIYKLVEPCFYFFHRLKAIPFFFLIYRPCLAQNKCSINICRIDFPVQRCGRKTLLLYVRHSLVRCL